MEPQMQSLAYTNLRAFVHDMDWSGNMLVVRTRVGGAQPVGLALDQLSIDGIIGTIAGDDTVLAVLAPNVDGETIANTIWMTIDRKETVA
jgi:transcriptional regulator of arginine metabolism